MDMVPFVIGCWPALGDLQPVGGLGYRDEIETRVRSQVDDEERCIHTHMSWALGCFHAAMTLDDSLNTCWTWTNNARSTAYHNLRDGRCERNPHDAAVRLRAIDKSDDDGTDDGDANTSTAHDPCVSTSVPAHFDGPDHPRQSWN